MTQSPIYKQKYRIYEALNQSTSRLTNISHLEIKYCLGTEKSVYYSTGPHSPHWSFENITGLKSLKISVCGYSHYGLLNLPLVNDNVSVTVNRSSTLCQSNSIVESSCPLSQDAVEQKSRCLQCFCSYFRKTNPVHKFEDIMFNFNRQTQADFQVYKCKNLTLDNVFCPKCCCGYPVVPDKMEEYRESDGIIVQDLSNPAYHEVFVDSQVSQKYSIVYNHLAFDVEVLTLNCPQLPIYDLDEESDKSDTSRLEDMLCLNGQRIKNLVLKSKSLEALKNKLDKISSIKNITSKF